MYFERMNSESKMLICMFVFAAFVALYIKHENCKMYEKLRQDNGLNRVYIPRDENEKHNTCSLCANTIRLQLESSKNFGG
jgi:hypothetical protein